MKYDMEQVRPSQQLLAFAYIPKFEDAFQALANMADPEDWDFSDARKKSNVILKNYIEHTFRKVKSEDKISYAQDNSYACFNTGLVTKNLEEIIGREPQDFYESLKQNPKIMIFANANSK